MIYYIETCLQSNTNDKSVYTELLFSHNFICYLFRVHELNKNFTINSG